MSDYALKNLIRSHFDKLIILSLIWFTGTAMIVLAHWQIAPEITMSIKDSYAGLIGALIALVTGKHADSSGAVIPEVKK
jgi:hypothetical protein